MPNISIANGFVPVGCHSCLLYTKKVLFSIHLGFGPKTHQPSGFEGGDKPGAQLVGFEQATTINTLKMGKYT